MAGDLYSLHLLAKLMVLSARSCLVWPLLPLFRRISAEQVPSLHRFASRYLKLVTFFNFWPFMLIFALMLFVHVLALFCAESHSVSRCFVYESVGEVLKFTIAAVHKIDVVGKS